MEGSSGRQSVTVQLQPVRGQLNRKKEFHTIVGGEEGDNQMVGLLGIFVPSF